MKERVRARKNTGDNMMIVDGITSKEPPTRAYIYLTQDLPQDAVIAPSYLS